MSLQRKDIRNTAVAILRKHVRQVKDIRANRGTVYEHNKLPAISLYTRSDKVTAVLSESGPRRYKRQLDMAIEIVVQHSADEKAADLLDEICFEIENALTLDDTLGGRVDDIKIGDVDFEYTAEEQETPVHAAVMLFAVMYNEFVPRDRNGQGVTDLSGFDVDWQLKPEDDPEPEAEDTVNVPLIGDP